ncbi:CLUMA_CG000402, isoform A [Clunio marinus]|uniref:CLUMA_CG000402, isoform A n=1 Tax=Clunio marinus TaxID=568069 RepID=A0A1J1HFW8_9DIPT|nr:CLUMA_CG000402, isoform A [Clunio marinus]
MINFPSVTYLNVNTINCFAAFNTCNRLSVGKTFLHDKGKGSNRYTSFKKVEIKQEELKGLMFSFIQNEDF